MKLDDNGRFKVELYEPESGDFSWDECDTHNETDMGAMLKRIGEEFRWWADEMASDLSEIMLAKEA